MMNAGSLLSLKELCCTKKVLYVEDDVHVRTQTRKMLQIYFNEIVEASDGVEGLKAFQKDTFDIVFTDITMPQMDGLSMIEAIRKINKTIPIVIFSAYDTTEYFLKTIKHDVSAYILKPFMFQEVVTALEKVARLFPSKTQGSQVFEYGYRWDTEHETLYQEEKEIKLSKREKSLFGLLLSSKYTIYSSEEIEIAVFDDDFSDNKRVRNLISRLRTKLGCDLIECIYAQGYKLKWLL